MSESWIVRDFQLLDFLAILRDHLARFGDTEDDEGLCFKWRTPDSLQVFEYMVYHRQREKFFKAGEAIPPAFHQSLVMLGDGHDFPLHRTSFADLWAAIVAERSRMVAEQSGLLEKDLHAMVARDVEPIDLTYVVHAAPVIEFMTQQERTTHPDAFIWDKRTSPPLLKVPNWGFLLARCRSFDWGDTKPLVVHIYAEDSSTGNGKHCSPPVEKVDVVEMEKRCLPRRNQCPPGSLELPGGHWFFREWLALQGNEDGTVEEALFREDETGMNILETFLRLSDRKNGPFEDCEWWLRTVDPKNDLWREFFVRGRVREDDVLLYIYRDRFRKVRDRIWGPDSD